jgi:hypothetical protein
MINQLQFQYALDTFRSQQKETRWTLHPTDDLWLTWLIVLRNKGFALFKFDVTFNSSGETPYEAKWLLYFDQYVTYKLRKAIGFQHPVVDVIREYEFDTHSIDDDLIDKRKPHHIHSIIAVPGERDQKMKSERMKKDLYSLKRISSIYIAAIPADGIIPGQSVERAFAYLRKRKTYRPLR